jgi:hypothetical protein
MKIKISVESIYELPEGFEYFKSEREGDLISHSAYPEKRFVVDPHVLFTDLKPGKDDVLQLMDKKLQDDFDGGFRESTTWIDILDDK